MAYTPESPVSALPGIGPERARAFARMGVRTLRDLLWHLPRAYENRGDVRLLRDGATDGEKSAFSLTVATEPRTALIRRGMSVTRFRAFDESGSVEVVFFNQNYVRDIFHTGAAFRFFGALSLSRSGLQLTGPAYEPILPDRPLPAFVPRYPLCEGLSSKIVEKAVLAAARALLPTLPDPLPEDIRRKEGLPALSYALMSVHAPVSEEAMRAGLRRLIFDELFCLSLGTALTRRGRGGRASLVCPPVPLDPLLAGLPYRLTGAQARVIEEIRGDMAAADRPPMSRILVGDVGCGKTICAAAAIYTAVRAGGQAALMAPTEILARQHYADLSALFAPLGIRVCHLLGADSAKEKRAVREAAAAGAVDVVIGTHALLVDGLSFSRLALTITDEQHRFGVRQRAVLKQKQPGAHLLVMSATPIPRTLALAMYGDLDISRIDEMPPGRQRVDTYVVNESYRDRLNGFIRRQVTEGGQVYIVCPSVDEKEEEGAVVADEKEPEEIPIDLLALAPAEREEQPPLKAATAYAAHLQTDVFPDLRVAFLHGRMKSAEKDGVMRRFAAGEIDILVSTTVIEVGVNVPRASLMVVENAERFGLSQLHQLRGRVGRGTRRSYCILVSDSHAPTARARLDVMHRVYDGFAIAEKDLAIRGPGDFLAAGGGGVRQSGAVSLPLIRLCHDAELVRAASDDAAALLASDPALANHPSLRAEVDRVFAGEDATLS